MRPKHTQDGHGFEDVEQRLLDERASLDPLALDRVRTSALARSRSGQKPGLWGVLSGQPRVALTGLTVALMAAGTGSVLAAGGASSPGKSAAAAQYSEEEEEGKAKVKGECKLDETSFHIEGLEGEHKKPFKIHFQSLGIKKITFYVDGKKYEVLKKPSAKHGKFTVTINPDKYSFGMHRVKVTTEVVDPNCDPIDRGGVFTRPKPEPKPTFTG